MHLPELVLALGSFRYLVDPRVLMLCTLLKGNNKSDIYLGERPFKALKTFILSSFIS